MNYEKYSDATAASPLQSVIREEMNMQIAAARQYPRSMRDFEKRAIAQATADEFVAASCLSSGPKGRKEGRMHYGPGIGNVMAEVVAAAYGNLRLNSLVVENTPRYVRARGFALDMDGNFGVTSESVVFRDGLGCAVVKEDEVEAARIAELAVARARRRAIWTLAPKTVWKAVDDACIRIVFADLESRVRALARVREWMSDVGIREDRVWRAFGVANEKALDFDDAVTLIGLRTAIVEGDTTVDEAFPRDSAPPRFIPPREYPPASGEGGQRASAPCISAQLAQLIHACHIEPEAILDYIRDTGQGSYRSLQAVPETVLHRVVRAWPDVVADIVDARGE